MSAIRCKDCRWGRKSGDGQESCRHWKWHSTAGEMPCNGADYLPPAGSAAYRAHQSRLHVNRTRRYRERIRQAGDRMVTLRLNESEAELLRSLSREHHIPTRDLVVQLARLFADGRLK